MTDLSSKNESTSVFSAFVIATAFFGAGIFAKAAYDLPLNALRYDFVLLGLLTAVLSTRSAFVFERFKLTITFGDVFVFLSVFLWGAEVGTILAFFDALLVSLRLTKQSRIRLFNVSVMVISIYLSAKFSETVLGSPWSEHKEVSELAILGLGLFSVLHFGLNSILTGYANSLRKGESFVKLWYQEYRWMILNSIATSSIAFIAALAINRTGFLSVLMVLPIVAIIYFSATIYRDKITAVTEKAEQSEQHLVALREKEARFRSAFDNAPIGMGLTTVDGRWQQVNEAICDILGYKPDELLGTSFRKYLYEADLPHFLEEVDQLYFGNNETFQTELRFYHREQRLIWTLTSASMISDAHEGNSGVILQIQDISAKKLAEDKLKHVAYFDSVTGLANRTNLLERLSQVLADAGANRQLCAIALFDLDRFKIINESVSHGFGDEVLKAVAHRLKRLVQPEDLVARFGSDEFAVLFSNAVDYKSIVSSVESIIHQIGFGFRIGENEAHLTASAGIIFWEETLFTPEELFRNADAALQVAKKRGRSSLVVFDDDMRDSALKRVKLENDLQKAVERSEIYLVYQPIVTLSDERLAGFEALVRWNHSTLGLINPAEFIPLAEETGAISEIGSFVLFEACRQLRQWQRQFGEQIPLTMAVNLSVRQLFQKNLFELVVNALEANDINPRQLKLEITESVIVENVQEVVAVLRNFKALGIQISMDDFGTGYSSLSYLHKLPVSTLKIDRSFVNAIGVEFESTEIVGTILSLAKTLRLEIVAEGIETEDQRAFLTELGCEYGQGYLFSKPIDAIAAGEMVHELARQSDQPIPETGADTTGAPLYFN